MYNDRNRDNRGYGRQDDRDHGRRRGVPLSDLDPALTEVSRKVIGASIEVHKAMGPGFSEDTYLAALRMELDAQGVKYTVRQEFPVVYKGQNIGSRSADLFVDGKFLVEVMAEPKEIGSLERLQLRSALKTADLELGLIINFAERRLKDGLVRVLNPEKIKSLRGDGDEIEAHDDGYGDEPRG
jgi:GxxExxY protein